MERKLQYIAADTDMGRTVKDVLQHHFHLSARQISRAKFMDGGILVNGVEVTVRWQLNPGDCLMVALEDKEAGSHQLIPQPGELDIRYEDEDLVLVNKPSGLVVHPSPGHYADSLANILVWHYGQKGEHIVVRPVGRLDRETSGLIYIAKNKAAVRKMELQRISGEMERHYLALVQMLVLFSVIAVIYKPLTYVQNIPEAHINTCITVAAESLDENNKDDKNIIMQMNNEKSYYRELYMLKLIDTNREAMVDRLVADNQLTEEEATATIVKMERTASEFSIFGKSLLEMPKTYGIMPNWTWLIVLASGLSAFLSSMLSMHYSKATMSKEQQQMGGCSTNMMMYMMPLMSLVISFTVPAGVAVYWTFSNLLAMLQTVILNSMWNPAKIRAQAEAEYAERRRKKKEDKERLKAARLAEQAAWQEEENKARARAKGDITQKKSAAPKATSAELPKEIVDEIPNESVSEEEA